MTFQVVDGVYEDMDAFNIIERDSYSDSPLEGVLFKSAQEGSSSFKDQTDRNIKQWKEDPATLYFKVIDTASSNEIVAFAEYKLYDESNLQLLSYPTAADVPRIFGDSANHEAAGDFFGGLWAGRERCIGKRPHLCK